ncbi:hypothetical protein M413DRAFT_29139 [Hebeloma cylindrosporum]|uniref:Translocon-associated protein subunit alpha n=1 Tax=Hebeloma cylindrosporum TaxID=76867 RepID=A0A0C3BTK1_HEBCY|nr:hypothetical protein M413DRAFT_29139 [Hebeloma cylindrosporum h7]
MRFGTLLTSVLSLATLTLAVAESVEEHPAPEVLATAAFPESNAFNHVVNGEKNTLTITAENKSGRNVTLLRVAGALLNADTNVVLKNLTSSKYGIPLIQDVKLQIPYSFHSEFKPGDHRLTIWLEHSTEGDTYKVEAYDSVITIVDPELSIFDLKLLSTYAIVAALLGGLLYYVYDTFVPHTKKPRAKKTSNVTVSDPVGTVTATGAGGYQEEWIPEHHLRKSKSAKKQGAVSGTSGDELSAVETSGTEGKRRKGKK